AAAVVSGEHSHTASSSVPERPGKLRGMVRKLLRPTAGACPIPIHPIHPDWCMRAPELIRLKVQPPLVRSMRISRDVGLISKDTWSCDCLFFRILPRWQNLAIQD